MITNAEKQIMLVPTIVDDIHEIEKFDLSKVLNNKSIYYNNLFFLPNGELRTRKGYHEVRQIELPETSEVVKVSYDTSGYGYFILLERQEKVLNNFEKSIENNKFKLSYTGEDFFEISKSPVLFFYLLDNSVLQLKTTNYLEETFSKIDEETKTVTFLFDFSPAVYEIDQKFNTIIQVNKKVLKVCFYDNTEFYEMKTIDNKDVSYAIFANPSFFQDNQTKSVLLGNYPLKELFYNEELSRYFIKDLYELIKIKKRGNFTFSSKPDKDHVVITLEAPATGTVIGKGKNIRIYNDKDELILEGVVEESLTAERTNTKHVETVKKPKRQITFLDDIGMLRSFPPFTLNIAWANIKHILANAKGDERNDYIKIDAQLEQYEIPNFFTPLRKDLVAYKSRETGVVYPPYIFNPLLEAYMTEDEMWQKFYDLQGEEIPQDLTPWQKRRFFQAHPQKIQIIEREEEEEVFTEVVKPVGEKPKTFTDLTIKIKKSKDNFWRETATKGELFVPAPILSSMIKVGGYFYGVAQTAFFQKNETTEGVMLYRTSEPGNIKQWFNEFLGNYLFIEVSGYFPKKDYPIGLGKLQNLLLIIGTENTQVWEVNNLPVTTENNTAEKKEQEGIKLQTLPSTARFLGKYRGGLPVGVLNNKLFFLSDNFITLLTTKGLVYLNPFTYNGFPEIIRESTGLDIFTKMSRQLTSLNYHKSFINVSQTDVFIKFGGQFQILLLSRINENNFNFSVFSTLLTRDLCLVENTDIDKIFYHQKTNKLILIKEVDNGYDTDIQGNIYPIEIRWELVGSTSLNTLWENYKIGVSCFVEADTQELLDIKIKSLRNRVRSNEIVLPVIGRRTVLHDQNAGENFFFTGQQDEIQKALMLLCDGYHIIVKGIVQSPITFNYLCLSGAEYKDY